MKTYASYRFGDFSLDSLNRTLARDGVSIPLNRRAFDVLLYLVANPGRVVTKEELLSSVWSDAPVDENNLNQSISALRKALDERPGEHASIITLAGRGYQFVRQVKTIPPPALSPYTQIEPSSSLAAQETPVSVSPPRRRYLRAALGFAAAVLAAFGGYLAWQHLHPRPNSATVVIANFVNTTGDATFDQTLDRALQIDLSQSPYMVVMSDREVVSMLGFMGRAPDTPLSAELARQICERGGRQAVLAGSIASVGSSYLLTLEATGCASGARLTSAKAQAPTKEAVLAAVDSLADRVRSKLGESAESRENYQVPLMKATTPSIEALKAYSMGDYLRSQGKEESESLAFYQKAVELDPGFAMAWGAMANDFYNLAEFDKASSTYKKAFQLSGPISAKEKLTIQAHYYGEGLRDIEDGNRIYKVWAATYPNDWAPLVNLCNQYTQLGQYPPAIEYGKRALQLQPDRGVVFSVLARALVRANRFADAKAVGAQAIQRGKDSVGLHATLYNLAFLENDDPAKVRESAWAAAHPDGWYNWFFPYMVASSDASLGKYRQAETLFRTSLEIARREQSTESADSVQMDQAEMEFDFGFPEAARATLQRIANQETQESDLAVLYARLGDTAPGQRFVSRYGSVTTDTTITGKALPLVRSAIAGRQGRLFEAVAALEPARPYELESYVVLEQRAALYLQAKDGARAIAEYHKILANPGLDPGRWTYPLAHLGLARAYALSGDTAASRNEYAALFAAFKDADPGLPVLQQARNEVSKLPTPTPR